MTELPLRVAVIGTGTWGTAAAGLLAPHVDKLALWARRREVAEAINSQHRNPVHLPDYQLPQNVIATSSLAEAVGDAEAIVLAVPSSFLRHTCSLMADDLAPHTPVLILTKGIEEGPGKLMADIVADEVGGRQRLAVLSGPNHAEEISAGKVSAAVIASESDAVTEFFRDLFVSPAFRAYASTDLTGVEICGAIKNVAAIACGMAAGLDAGDNTIAVLMTRALAEIGRFVSVLGGEPLTCMGLAGMGDLVVTCTSQHSRNRSFGLAFAKGESLALYEDRTHMVVEGARAVVSAHQLAERHGIEAPICHAVYQLLYEDALLADAIGSLLDREPHQEFYGYA